MDLYYSVLGPVVGSDEQGSGLRGCTESRKFIIYSIITTLWTVPGRRVRDRVVRGVFGVQRDS